MDTELTAFILAPEPVAKPWLRRVPEDCPQGILELWQACIQTHPRARPSAAEVYAALDGQLGPLQSKWQVSTAATSMPSTPSSATGPPRHDTAYAPRSLAEAADVLDTVRALR